MQFNSYSYLVLLIPVTVLFWNLPVAWRKWYLLAVSAAFYASWSVTYAAIPYALIGMSWLVARRMIGASTEKDKSFWLTVGIAAVLAVLAFFKYRDFALVNMSMMLAALGAAPIHTTLQLALPLGISFYAFEAVSYLIDTRQGRVRDARFQDLALFVTFWPHMIAGPIVRVREFFPQIEKPKPFSTLLLVEGCDRLLWGLVQKNLIANNLAGWVSEGFLPQAAAANSTLDNWALTVGFGLQIYFDFASYSNMAIGASRLVGIVLPENFRFPYHAASPPDFWGRWHMTLSRWIRDYLFFPVNAKYKGAQGPLYLSLLGIMALVGLWHGAGWGFMLWGLFHGVYLALYRMWEHVTETRYPQWAKSAAWGWFWRVFILAGAMLAWVPFRSSSLGQTVTLLKSMLFSFRFHVSYSLNFYLTVALVSLFCMLEPWLCKQLRRRLVPQGAAAPWPVWNIALARPMIYAGALLLFLIFDDKDVQFIYFQF
ncbi:MAG TPA: MBOAT family O-acyltransferase [Armatimonadota bacterium]|jgi:alginate O-acetyltransferase complex protein AlgI